MADTRLQFPVHDCNCDHDWGDHGSDSCLVDTDADDLHGPVVFCPCTAHWAEPEQHTSTTPNSPVTSPVTASPGMSHPHRAAATAPDARDRSPVAVARVEAHDVVLDAGTFRLLLARLTAVQLDRLAAVFADVIEDLRPLVDHLDPSDPQPPAEPRARALWLRQHRNTGPAQHRRAPRALTPRGGR